jgi:hypothetical protein
MIHTRCILKYSFLDIMVDQMNGDHPLASGNPAGFPSQLQYDSEVWLYPKPKSDPFPAAILEWAAISDQGGRDLL